MKFKKKLFWCLILLAILFAGGRLDLRSVLQDLSHGGVSFPAQVGMGSCYAYEYGYDVPVVMNYTSYMEKTPFRMKLQEEKPLWLAVHSNEPSRSLEEGSFHVTFPPSVRVRFDKPWVCLGTNSNACYIEFNRSLNPDGSICLEPIFVTPMMKETVVLSYNVSTKDHRSTPGHLKLAVR